MPSTVTFVKPAPNLMHDGEYACQHAGAQYANRQAETGKTKETYGVYLNLCSTSEVHAMPCLVQMELRVVLQSVPRQRLPEKLSVIGNGTTG